MSIEYITSPNKQDYYNSFNKNSKVGDTMFHGRNTIKAISRGKYRFNEGGILEGPMHTKIITSKNFNIVVTRLEMGPTKSHRINYARSRFYRFGFVITKLK